MFKDSLKPSKLYVPTKADSLRKGGRMPRQNDVEGEIGIFPPDTCTPGTPFGKRSWMKSQYIILCEHMYLRVCVSFVPKPVYTIYLSMTVFSHRYQFELYCTEPFVKHVVVVFLKSLKCLLFVVNLTGIISTCLLYLAIICIVILLSLIFICT